METFLVPQITFECSEKYLSWEMVDIISNLFKQIGRKILWKLCLQNNFQHVWGDWIESSWSDNNLAGSKLGRVWFHCSACAETEYFWSEQNLTKITYQRHTSNINKLNSRARNTKKFIKEENHCASLCC